MPLTDTDHDHIRRRHADGLTLGAIARELGVHPSTVSRAAKRLGLEWDRGATEAATERHKLSSAEKRATLEGRLLDEAGLLLDQLHTPHVAFNFGGKDNTYAEHTMPEPDIPGKRNLVAAAGTAIDKAVRLAEVDKATEHAEAGASMVGGLFAALKLAAEEGGTVEGPATDER